MMEDWSRYADIIGIEHFEPREHQRMSAYDRAAQFAPFAALTGYDAMVSETSRLTDSKGELDEAQMLALNETLADIMDRINEHPRVLVIWFRKDARKQGGAYLKTEGTVQNVEPANRLVILKDGSRISMDDIAAITLL